MRQGAARQKQPRPGCDCETQEDKEVLVCQPRGSAAFRGARVLPGMPTLGSREHSLHLKSQADPQSPIFVLPARSREVGEAARGITAWTHLSGIVGRVGELLVHTGPCCPRHTNGIHQVQEQVTQKWPPSPPKSAVRESVGGGWRIRRRAVAMKRRGLGRSQ